jgi:hypothetical protein
MLETFMSGEFLLVINLFVLQFLRNDFFRDYFVSPCPAFPRLVSPHPLTGKRAPNSQSDNFTGQFERHMGNYNRHIVPRGVLVAEERFKSDSFLFLFASG